MIGGSTVGVAASTAPEVAILRAARVSQGG
jgi:hypothetical protein